LFTLSLLSFVIYLKVQLLQATNHLSFFCICETYLGAIVKAGESVAGKDVSSWMAEQLQSGTQNGDLKK